MHANATWFPVLALSLLLAGGSPSGPGEASVRPGSGLDRAASSVPPAEFAHASADDSSSSVPRPWLLSSSRQHVVAVMETSTSTTGLLYRFEPRDGEWRSVGEAMPIVVGRNGVGPKRESDGRSPQGMFPLGFAFGYEAEPPTGTELTYRPLTPESVCVDDSNSSHYNRVVFEPREEEDWESAEAMRRDLAYGDELYSLGITVEYNADAVPGAGSCIFLHVWRGPGSPTTGCTAMSESHLRTLLRWLRPGHQPVLIQGTRAYLDELRSEGRLPYPVPNP